MRKSVLHLNTNLTSAAVTIPYRIHQGFLKHGWDSKMITANVDDLTKYDNIIEIPHQKNVIKFTILFLRYLWFGRIAGHNKYYFFPHYSIRTISINKLIKLIGESPDYIIAHWTSFFFNAKLIYKIAAHFKVPVIFYLMDEEPYTGGCHMTYGCDNYKYSCVNCPALKSKRKHGQAFRSARFKRKWIDKLQPIALAASEYSFEKLRESYIFKNVRKEKILLPFDETVYSPGNKREAQLKLGLSSEKKYILFGAASIEREEKGMIYLLESLQLLYNEIGPNSNVHILVVGAGDILHSLPFPYTSVGFIDSGAGMADIYRACDVYLCSSIQDAGPAMINEAMLCGRPVVAFKMGVAMDMIVPETGYIAELKNSQDLAIGLKKFLQMDEVLSLLIENKCREVAVEKCGLLSQLNKIDQLIAGDKI